jgi:hypothetical protein
MPDSYVAASYKRFKFVKNCHSRQNYKEQGATNMRQIQAVFKNVYLLRPFFLDSYNALSADLI